MAPMVLRSSSPDSTASPNAHSREDVRARPSKLNGTSCSRPSSGAPTTTPTRPGIKNKGRIAVTVAGPLNVCTNEVIA